MALDGGGGGVGAGPALHGMVSGACALAGVAIDLLSDPALLEQVRKDLSMASDEWVPLEPDFSRLRRVLLLEGEPDRVPNAELHVDWQIKQAFLVAPSTRCRTMWTFVQRRL